ncbi:MAG: DUF3857 domain-containing protein [Saprospiraceae bacterium]
MKKHVFLLFVNILLLHFSILAKNGSLPTGDTNYSIRKIPFELLKNANAVVRMDYTYFELKSKKKATVTRKYAITILNNNADSYAQFREYYDDFTKIKSIKGIIYDKNGKVIKKIKKKEINDVSAVSNISLIEDTRMKYIEVLQNNYPFTIEFEFKKEFSGMLSYPRWIPVGGYKMAVEQSTYIAKVPNKLGMRYLVKNFSNEPKITSESDSKIYTWNVENFQAIDSEPYSPDYRKFLPMVYISPNEFEYDGYAGNMETWESFGKWLKGLEEGRDELKKETIQKVNELVVGVENDEEKVKIIYEYLQSKTRYISIQLGIGGWQPFKAEEVDKNGYGDCKALSNYTLAMLKAVGIKSYNASIGAGRGHPSFDPNFPSMGFANHQILCVPLENDTIWLECTSQDSPFGFMGSFTDDRNALLYTEDGGKIVRTTRYPQEVNTQNRVAKVKIDTKGNARANIVTKYQGLQYENVQYQFKRNEKEQKEELFENLDIPNMEIESFKYSQVKDRIPEATEEIDLQIKNYASVSGKRIFIPFNILNRRKKTPPKVKDRKTEVVINMAFIDTDKIIYEVPNYYDVEYLPESVSFESDFGSYAVTISKEGNQVTYVRTLKLNKNTYPAERYDDLLKFYKKIVREDKMKLVILEEDRP